MAGAEGGSSVTSRGAPGMKDVARLAGVSHQTVSRVLNDHPSVRPDTKARVMAAVEALGYRPNSAARTLATGRSRVIGILTMSGHLFGPASTLYGVEGAASNIGYSISVVSMRELSAAELRQGVIRLMRQGVAGVVVIAPIHFATGELDPLATEVPLVAVEGTPEGALSVVSVDQVLGARLATQHLLDLGHRTVWHVAGPADWFEAAYRIQGWRSALVEAGCEQPPILPGDWSARTGYEAGQLLVRLSDVTSVFAANDQMALGVLRALAEHGRRVPDDVSVVGFDDLPESEYLTPPLTTIRQDFAEVGRRGVAQLLEQIETGERAEQRVQIAPSLVVRQSTACFDASRRRP